MSTVHAINLASPAIQGGDNGFFSNLGGILTGIGNVISATQNQPPVWGTAGSNPSANNPQPTQQTQAVTTGTTNTSPLGIPIGVLVLGGLGLLAILVLKK